MKIDNPIGSTPIDEDILQGLIPNLTLQKELDEFEAYNIAEASRWAFASKSLKKDLLSASGLIQLHRNMFKDTWTWAGKFRWKQTNIGVSPEEIQNKLGQLLGDIHYWKKNGTFSLDEIAIRLHHKLVWIHPFPNGNGRFSRLTADLFLTFNGVEKFQWGTERDQYIKALKIADASEDYRELLKFARRKS